MGGISRSKRRRWVGHIARMEWMRTAHRKLVENPDICGWYQKLRWT